MVVDAAGIVVFRIVDRDKIETLLLDHGTHLGYPKGHVEYDEDFRTTALRELYEEAGIMPILISDDIISLSTYQLPDGREKVVRFFGGLVSATSIVTISSEHYAYYWVDLAAALYRLTHEEGKQVLKAAIEWLESLGFDEYDFFITDLQHQYFIS